MGYTIDQFGADCHRILSTNATPDGREEIRRKLEQLMVDPAFIATTFSKEMPPGKRILYHDPETDVHVLAHVLKAGKKSGRPHSHGTSWAIYGMVSGILDMTEWRRVNGPEEDHAELQAAARYPLKPGEARTYEPGMIHSTGHPDGGWAIRVTGTNFDNLPRFHFNPQRDRIAADT
jgi:hypothetical protein